MGRVRLFLSAQATENGPWQRVPGEVLSETVSVLSTGTSGVDFGPISLEGAPAGSAAVRVEAVLDAVTVDPGGSTIVVWDVATMASPASCAAEAGAQPGRTLIPSGFSGTCSGERFEGQVVIANLAGYTQSVRADVSLAYARGGAWTRHAGASQTYSTSISAYGSVTVPASFGLTGIPADATAVRAEMVLSGTDFVAGQARRTHEEASSPSVTCSPVTGAAAKDGTYKVVLGDTMARVAATTKTSVADLAAANGLSEDATLSVGQALMVPKSAVKPATTPARGGSQPARTIAAGEPEPKPSKTPVARPTPTPEDEERAPVEGQGQETAEAADEETTEAAGPVNTPPVQGDGDPGTEETAASGGLSSLVKPAGMGIAVILLLGGGGYAAYRYVRRRGQRAGSVPRAAVGGIAGLNPAAPLPPAAPPPGATAPLPAPPQPNRNATREAPAAIPLSGDMRDLLGIERNRTPVAAAFVPDPDAVVSGDELLLDARELARSLGRMN
jgi:LysM repeat protein